VSARWSWPGGQYDGLGRLWKQTDALGRQSTTYTYDEEKRLTDIPTSPNAVP